MCLYSDKMFAVDFLAFAIGINRPIYSLDENLGYILCMKLIQIGGGQAI